MEVQVPPVSKKTRTASSMSHRPPQLETSVVYNDLRGRDLSVDEKRWTKPERKEPVKVFSWSKTPRFPKQKVANDCAPIPEPPKTDRPSTRNGVNRPKRPATSAEIHTSKPLEEAGVSFTREKRFRPVSKDEVPDPGAYGPGRSCLNHHIGFRISQTKRGVKTGFAIDNLTEGGPGPGHKTLNFSLTQRAPKYVAFTRTKRFVDVKKESAPKTRPQTSTPGPGQYDNPIRCLNFNTGRTISKAERFKPVRYDGDEDLPVRPHTSRETYSHGVESESEESESSEDGDDPNAWKERALESGTDLSTLASKLRAGQEVEASPAKVNSIWAQVLDMRKMAKAFVSAGKRHREREDKINSIVQSAIEKGPALPSPTSVTAFKEGTGPAAAAVANASSRGRKVSINVDAVSTRLSQVDEKAIDQAIIEKKRNLSSSDRLKHTLQMAGQLSLTTESTKEESVQYQKLRRDIQSSGKERLVPESKMPKSISFGIKKVLEYDIPDVCLRLGYEEKPVAILRNTDLYFSRGYCHRAEGNFEEAITAYTRAIELDPTNSKAYLNRGYCFDQLRQHDKALENYIKVKELEPESIHVHYNCGVSLKLKGDLDAAIAEFTKCIEEDNTNPDTFVNRALCFRKQGRFHEACADYTRARALAHVTRKSAKRSRSSTPASGGTSGRSSRMDDMIRPHSSMTNETGSDGRASIMEVEKKFKFMEVLDHMPDLKLFISSSIEEKLKNERMTELIIQFVEGLPFFMKMPLELQKKLARVMEYDVKPKKAHVFEQGEWGDMMYIILSGSVEVTVKRTAKAKPISVSSLNCGDCFGETALVAKEEAEGIRTSTVVCKEKSEFFVVEKTVYDRMVTEYENEELEKRVKFMRGMNVFREYSKIKAVAATCTEVEFQANELIFKQGTRSTGVYMIITGHCYLIKELQVFENKFDKKGSTREVVVDSSLGVSDYVGEECIAEMDNPKHRFTVRCVSYTKCLFLDVDDFPTQGRLLDEVMSRYRAFYPSDQAVWAIYNREKGWETYKQRLVNHILNKK